MRPRPAMTDTLTTDAAADTRASAGDACPADALARFEAAGVAHSLDASGHAVVPELLTRAQCQQLAALYAREDGFRSRVVMARHGFGRGEYKYFAYPLPPMLDALRHALYPRLAPIANRWQRQLGFDARF